MKSLACSLPLALGACLLGAPAAWAQTPAASDDTIVLSPFEISSQRETVGYRSDTVISGAMIALPQNAIPSMINVVGADLIAERNLLNIEQVFTVVSGVTPVGIGDGGYSFRVRGFGAPTLRNGFGNGLIHDLANIERIEVAKGPNSVLFGGGAFGGAVNRITKRALFKAAHSLSFSAGSYGYFDAMLDSTAAVPIFGGDKVAYRLIARHQESDSEIAHRRIDHLAITPSLRITPWKNRFIRKFSSWMAAIPNLACSLRSQLPRVAVAR